MGKSFRVLGVEVRGIFGCDMEGEVTDRRFGILGRYLKIYLFLFVNRLFKSEIWIRSFLGFFFFYRECFIFLKDCFKEIFKIGRERKERIERFFCLFEFCLKINFFCLNFEVLVVFI